MDEVIFARSCSQVPVLEQSNLHLIRPNSLVRFRGMVQDMLGNELYIGAFKVLYSL